MLWAGLSSVRECASYYVDQLDSEPMMEKTQFTVPLGIGTSINAQSLLLLLCRPRSIYIFEKTDTTVHGRLTTKRYIAP
jgi:hypothetical protein